MVYTLLAYVCYGYTIGAYIFHRGVLGSSEDPLLIILVTACDFIIYILMLSGLITVSFSLVMKNERTKPTRRKTIVENICRFPANGKPYYIRHTLTPDETEKLMRNNYF